MSREDVLRLYQSGSYGTPENPIRSNSVKAAFWKGYFNHPGPARNAVNYEAYMAGKIASRG